jgi:hypothetical protein
MLLTVSGSTLECPERQTVATLTFSKMQTMAAILLLTSTGSGLISQWLDKRTVATK